MSRESQLWRWLSGGRLPGGHFCRVESGETSPGIPDVYYCLPNGTRGWMELKVESSSTARNPLKRRGLRPDQIRWITEETRDCRGIVWIVVRLGTRVHFISSKWANDMNGWPRAQFEKRAALTLRNGSIKVDCGYQILKLLIDL